MNTTVDTLFRKIGELTIQVDLLKAALAQAQTASKPAPTEQPKVE